MEPERILTRCRGGAISYFDGCTATVLRNRFDSLEINDDELKELRKVIDLKLKQQ